MYKSTSYIVYIEQKPSQRLYVGLTRFTYSTYNEWQLFLQNDLVNMLSGKLIFIRTFSDMVRAIRFQKQLKRMRKYKLQRTLPLLESSININTITD